MRLGRNKAEATKQDLVDMETRLLTAFYDFAQSFQKNLEQLHRTDYSLGERLAKLENRLLHVEKRLNMPPEA